MNSDQFLVMDAIVRLGSFNAAAGALNRVQSAVSYNIKTLEEELELKLFSREAYRPSLTPVGEAIYRKAKVLLAELEEIRILSEQLRLGQEPLLRMDLSPLCPLASVTPIFRGIADRFPQTRLEISMEVFGGEALVLNDEADLSLTDQVEQDDRLESIPWQNIPLLPVVSSTHPLASQAPQPSKTEIARHCQIVVSSRSRHMVPKSLGVAEGNLTWRVNDFPTKRGLIIEGVGWGHMPRTMIEADLEKGTLFTLDFSYIPKQTARLHLIRKRSYPHGPVAEHLWRLLAALVPGSVI